MTVAVSPVVVSPVMDVAALDRPLLDMGLMVEAMCEYCDELEEASKDGATGRYRCEGSMACMACMDDSLRQEHATEPSRHMPVGKHTAELSRTRLWHSFCQQKASIYRGIRDTPARMLTCQ